MSGCRIGTVRWKAGGELRPFRTVGREVNRDAEAKVSQLLDGVRSGDVRAVGIVAVKRGGDVMTGWALAPEGSFHALNSGATLLVARLAQPEEQ